MVLMSLVANLLLLVIASVILARVASALVHALAALGGYFRLSEFTVSFILMAIVTSLPEVVVGISSALASQPTLSLGNALGSNLVDLTLIVAIPVLLAGSLPVRSLLTRRDAIHMTIIALIPLLMLIDRNISRIDAFILIILYGLYLFQLLQQRTRFDGFANHVSRKIAFKQSIVITVGTAFLLGSAWLLVHSATNLATIFHIPVSLVGIILIAVGTSLPELAFGLKAVTLKHEAEVLGNVLGSVVANSTLVLAITALISPIQVQDFSVILTIMSFLIVVLVLFLVGVYTDKKLDTKEALVLLLVYFLFLISEFGVEVANRLGNSF